MSDALPPFEIAVSLNPHVEAVAVATALTQPAANAAVRDLAARYVERHRATVTGERVDKRGYLRLRLTLPGAEQATITVLARFGATRFDR